MNKAKFYLEWADERADETMDVVLDACSITRATLSALGGDDHVETDGDDRVKWGLGREPQRGAGRSPAKIF